MKNIAIMLRKEKKTSTKLYKDLKIFDQFKGRLTLSNLEVNSLTLRQRSQLKSMKFSPDISLAVNAALSSIKATNSRENSGRRAERY